MAETTENTLVGKPVTLNGREVGRVSSVRDGYDGVFIRLEVWEPKARSLLSSPSAGAVDVTFKV